MCCTFVDKDECIDLLTNRCSKKATCENTDGGFTCTCFENYTGDGQVCFEKRRCTKMLQERTYVVNGHVLHKFHIMKVE